MDDPFGVRGVSGGTPVRLTVPGLAVVLLSTSACEHGSAAKEQMSAQYNCPADSIQVTTMSTGAYRAQGCGHTVTYVCNQPMDSPNKCIEASAFAADAGPSGQ
jgi:hypothetical protein